LKEVIDFSIKLVPKRMEIVEKRIANLKAKFDKDENGKEPVPGISML